MQPARGRITARQPRRCKGRGGASAAPGVSGLAAASRGAARPLPEPSVGVAGVICLHAATRKADIRQKLIRLMAELKRRQGLGPVLGTMAKPNADRADDDRKEASRHGVVSLLLNTCVQ